MCTSIQMKSSDGGLIFARTMDWHTYTPEIIQLPKETTWTSVVNQARVQNKYNILSIGRKIPTIHPSISDGINEYGLSMQKLTFSNRSEYSETLEADKLNLAPFEFLLWALGNCRSVKELKGQLGRICLISTQAQRKAYGQNDFRFVATDPTGEMIHIEPISRRLEIIENRLGVVTNTPNFAREMSKLEDYMDFSEVPKGINQLSTGDFSGKPVVPGSYTPRARFVRASILKEHAIEPTNAKENLVETWHILNSVTVPKSNGRSETYTIYRSGFDLKNLKLYFQPYDDLGVKIFDFTM